MKMPLLFIICCFVNGVMASQGLKEWAPDDAECRRVVAKALQDILGDRANVPIHLVNDILLENGYKPVKAERRTHGEKIRDLLRGTGYHAERRLRQDSMGRFKLHSSDMLILPLSFKRNEICIDEVRALYENVGIQQTEDVRGAIYIRRLINYLGYTPVDVVPPEEERSFYEEKMVGAAYDLYNVERPVSSEDAIIELVRAFAQDAQDAQNRALYWWSACIQNAQKSSPELVQQYQSSLKNLELFCTLYTQSALKDLDLEYYFQVLQNALSAYNQVYALKVKDLGRFNIASETAQKTFMQVLDKEGLLSEKQKREWNDLLSPPASETESEPPAQKRQRVEKR